MDFESVLRKACRRKRFSRAVRGTSKVVPKGHVVVAWKKDDSSPICHFH